MDDFRQPSHSDLVSCMNWVAARLDQPIEDTNPNGSTRPRFGQHAMRASGAQMMSSLQVDVHLIKLMGRWGSDAITRYVQEAPVNHHAMTGAQ